MRLINAETYQLKHFLDPSEIPQYAILSHTWGDDEVSLQEMQDLGLAMAKKGFRKVTHGCDLAKKNGLSWIWIDTCCIDKTSSAEISEAINSMFSWYSNSSICYAHLEDVVSVESLVSRSKVSRHSRDWQPPRWFTRGWTLQELLAPTHIEFYSGSWLPLGSRSEHQLAISDLTGIDPRILDGSLNLDDVPVAKRMFWASRRRTSRKEDEAYCLLGIFNVNVPILYGEGAKAFERLLQEIITNTEDQSIFLWGSHCLPEPSGGFTGRLKERAWLAESTDCFRHPVDVYPVFSDFDPDVRVTTKERGTRITARAVKLGNNPSLQRYADFLARSDGGMLWAMGLNCAAYRSDGSGPDDKPDTVERLVAVIVKPSDTGGSRAASMKRFGDFYITVPREEMEKWPIVTFYLQNAELSHVNFSGAAVYWITPTFGYKEDIQLVYVNRTLPHISPECNQVRYVWGVVLEQSESLPWVVVTIGQKPNSAAAFCDVWRVPELVRSRLTNLEGEKKPNHSDRASILCDARIEDLFTSGRGVRWMRRHRKHGTWAKSTCWLEGGLELTSALVASSLEIAIRPLRNIYGDTGSLDRSEAIWRYIETSALPGLKSLHDRYKAAHSIDMNVPCSDQH